MKSFKETFEDPFETASNIERRERGEPDFKPTALKSWLKPEGEKLVDVKKFIGFLKNMPKDMKLIFENVEGDILVSSTDEAAGIIKMTNRGRDASWGGLRVYSYISQLQLMLSYNNTHARVIDTQHPDHTYRLIDADIPKCTVIFQLRK